MKDIESSGYISWSKSLYSSGIWLNIFLADSYLVVMYFVFSFEGIALMIILVPVERQYKNLIASINLGLFMHMTDWSYL